MQAKTILILLMLFVITGFSQQVLTQEQMIRYVKEYHPVSVQGKLLVRRGEKTLNRARGNFDPKIQGTLDQKQFASKEYYHLVNGGLKIPTWYGVEFKSGFEQNRGAFLNPENNNPTGGLFYAGVSVPVGRGLMIDERRSALQQARIYADATNSERVIMMNDLLFDAIKSYWKWVEAWNRYLVYEESLELTKTRFEAVKQSYLLGDIPAVDTLESYIQIQNREMNRNQARIHYRNQTLDLSNFLWFENNVPLVVTDSLTPPLYDLIDTAPLVSADSIGEFIRNLEATHPLVQIYDYKLLSVSVEQRMKAEALKPTLNVNYNMLNEPVGSDIVSNITTQNYKWGLELSFPLFLRKERNDLQLTRIKQTDTEMQRQQKLLEIQNKLRTYYNEQSNLEEQVNLFTDAAENYNRLLTAEQEKFAAGESSLFLINSREISLIQARLKLIELISKYQIASQGIYWSNGNLYKT